MLHLFVFYSLRLGDVNLGCKYAMKFSGSEPSEIALPRWGSLYFSHQHAAHQRALIRADCQHSIALYCVSEVCRGAAQVSTKSHLRPCKREAMKY